MAQIKRYTFTVCDEYVDYGGLLAPLKREPKVIGSDGPHLKLRPFLLSMIMVISMKYKHWMH